MSKKNEEGIPNIGSVGGPSITNISRGFSSEEPGASQLKYGNNPLQRRPGKIRKKKDKSQELLDLIRSMTMRDNN
jgi:hypothetical protein